jgi:hypothetical protein
MVVKVYRAKRGKNKKCRGGGEREREKVRTNPYKNYTSPKEF